MCYGVIMDAKVYKAADLHSTGRLAFGSVRHNQRESYNTIIIVRLPESDHKKHLHSEI